MSVRLLEYPGDADWQGVYQRARVTVGSSSITVPPITWRKSGRSCNIYEGQD